MENKVTNKNTMYGVRIDHIANAIKIANFSGIGTNNAFGNRYVLLDLFPADAERLKELGYNVKYYAKPDSESPIPQLEVKMKFRRINGEPVKYPPLIYSVIKGKVSEPLDETTIAELDKYVRSSSSNGKGSICDCSLVINPYFSNGHVTAYVETAYFVIDPDAPHASANSRRVDPFAEMYGNE